MIDYDRLEDSAQEMKDRFAAGDPFPHIVIDEVFEPARIADAARHFPTTEAMPERQDRKGVLELTDRSEVHPLLREASDELMGDRFVGWLSQVTGIGDLRTDPGGAWGLLRQSGDGVEGKIHVAPAKNPTNGWYRRLTLILHLTEGLTEDNGGFFQLWDADKTEARVKIAPLFNRAVVFLNTPTAFHSASKIFLPDGRTRKLMQTLYYTQAAPDGADDGT